MSNFAFVLDTNKRPLDPVHPAKARLLLSQGKAAVFRRYPFTIILKEVSTEAIQELEIKIDPGSKTTGIAIVQGEKVIFGAELIHRGQMIKASLESRRSLRRNRRNRHTRYRQARFSNRTRPKGWLAPSLQHRVETTVRAYCNTPLRVKKLIKLAPISSIAMELVKFDLQQEENPEITGIEYQQGELRGYEVREYLLEKWERKCAYCGAENLQLQVEHIQPKAKGGSDRISNLCLACEKCNQKKGTQSIEKFLAKKPEILKRILAQAKRPLKDATAVNSTRWALFNRLKETGLPVVTGSGGLTVGAYCNTPVHRIRLNFSKAHWIDAACVGKIESLKLLTAKPLLIKATGHGTRQMCRTNEFGFPTKYIPRFKFVKGFQTGDIVKAIVTKGKKIGKYVGRVAIRTRGSFNISASKLVTDINHKYCQIVHHKDGYNYGF